MELNIITGEIIYKNVDFSFVYSKGEIRLIPSKEDRKTIMCHWLMSEIAPGVFSDGDPLFMEEPYLLGKCNETGYRVAFMFDLGSPINSYNSTLIISVSAVAEIKDSGDMSRMRISSPVLDHIHPVNRGYTQSFPLEGSRNDGVIEIIIKGFDAMTTERKSFRFLDKEIWVQFSMGYKCSQKIGDSPISIFSNLLFEFEPTSDFVYLLKLYRLGEELVKFLSYRRDIGVFDVSLSTWRNNKFFWKNATLEILSVTPPLDLEPLKKGWYITVDLLEGNENNLLQAISDNVLYLRHIPRTSDDWRIIDASRFVLLTAAFEWEFERLYPEGILKRKAEAESKAIEMMQSLIDENTGDVKSFLKFAKKSIGFTNLQAKMIHAAKEFDSVIGDFGKRLFDLNNERFNYATIGKRLSEQRNNFAHGNLNKEFDGVSCLDLIFLEYLILAIQLHQIGVSDEGIRKSINQLFGLRIPV